MLLFGLAGGAAFFGEEDILAFCGIFVVLPAVALLIVVAWAADSLRAGWAALAVAGIMYLASSLLVARYTALENTEVNADQANGRQLVSGYGWLTATAGCALVAVAARRLVRRLWCHPSPSARRLSTTERLAAIDEAVTRGLISPEEADGLRHRLLPAETERQHTESA